MELYLLLIFLGILVLYLKIKHDIIASGILQDVKEIKFMLCEIRNNQLGNTKIKENQEGYVVVEDVCPACNAKIGKDDKTCPSCGLNFE